MRRFVCSWGPVTPAYAADRTAEGSSDSLRKVAHGRHGKHGQGRANHEGTPRDTNDRPPESLRGVQPRLHTDQHGYGVSDVAAAASRGRYCGDLRPKALPTRSAFLTAAGADDEIAAPSHLSPQSHTSSKSPRIQPTTPVPPLCTSTSTSNFNGAHPSPPSPLRSSRSSVQEPQFVTLSRTAPRF